MLDYLKEQGSATGPELADSLGVTRQAVNQHIQHLLSQRAIAKTGSTRAARYYLPEDVPEGRRLERSFDLAKLDESAVYQAFALALNLRKLRENVESIVHYAFTEMLNNAIDHSNSDRCSVTFEVDPARVRFTVRDFGIGVFHSIADKLDLADEHAAMIELIKGKTTTQPERHSGEGIFFVSKAADRYTLRSHRIQLCWDRHAGDVFASDSRYLEGTLVEFEVQSEARTRLEAVFEEFAPPEYDFRFEKTRVLVRLLRDDYVSRSEARRLLHKLDRFSEVELDMREVQNIGQGFVDEIFRVFASAHPSILVRAVNASAAVGAMIRHAGGSVG
jgi:anti-sigma regulatory factor (Ser/Thr protein kinase)